MKPFEKEIVISAMQMLFDFGSNLESEFINPWEESEKLKTREEAVQFFNEELESLQKLHAHILHQRKLLIELP